MNEISRLSPAGFDNFFIVQDDKLVGIQSSDDGWACYRDMSVYVFNPKG
ncbi:MAG: hypothetical protein IIB17_03460 [Chloroflexi bacterium]|nr:hypothetical protein [Chloroflexota bacterium]